MVQSQSESKEKKFKEIIFRNYNVNLFDNIFVIFTIRQSPPLKNACGPSCLRVFLKFKCIEKFYSNIENFHIIFFRYSYPMQSNIPLNCISPSAFFNACNLVFTTSNGFTDNAANEPAAQPEANDTKNAASPLPSFLRGPN